MEDKISTKINETKRDILNSKQVKKVLDNKLVKQGLNAINKGIRQVKLKTLDKNVRTDEQQLRVLLIRSLESSNNILLNKEKFNIAYDFIINNPPLYLPIDEKYKEENIMTESFESLKKFFNNEFINNMDNESFKNYLNNGLKYANYYVLNKITSSNLNIPKKLSAINYCYDFIEKYYSHSNLSKKQLEKDLDKNLFKIIFNKANTLLTDKDYDDLLQRVKNSNKPLNYSNILNNNLLTKTKKESSLSILDASNLKDEEIYSKIATSNILKVSSKEDYELLLKIFLYYYTNKDLQKVNILNTLYNSEILIPNQNRFNKFVNKLIDNEDINYLNDFINKILLSTKSLYYNDTELELLYHTLKNIYNTDIPKYNVCVNLCTSEKVKSIDKIELIKFINTHDLNEISIYFAQLSKLSNNHFKNAYELLRINIVSKITEETQKEELKYSKLLKN